MKAVGYSLFCALWKELTPQVVITRPMSDLCWVCQKNSNMIVRAHNRPVEEKSEVNLLICMCVHVHSLHPHSFSTAIGTTQGRGTSASCNTGALCIQGGIAR